MLAAVDAQADQLVEVRRDLHAHPELSWAEERTTAMIAKRLDQVGLVPTLLPRNGLVVDIGSGTGPLVALRADLDALPVEDRTDDPWASTVAGRRARLRPRRPRLRPARGGARARRGSPTGCPAGSG